MCSEVGIGLVNVYMVKLNVGFIGLKVFCYGGSLFVDGYDYVYNCVYDVDILVIFMIELSYKFFLEFSGGDLVC